MHDRRDILGMAVGAAAVGALGGRSAFAQSHDHNHDHDHSHDHAHDHGGSSLNKPLDAYEITKSVYVQEVGEAQVISVSDGALALPSNVMAVNRDSSEPAQWARSQGFDPQNVPTGLNPMLVRTGERLILIDSGYGRVDGAGPQYGNLFDRLGSVGITPGDITDVVLTHFHGDHINGLVKLGSDALGEGVRMHASERELDFWSGPNPDLSTSGLPASRHQPMIAGAKQFIEKYESRLDAFGDSKEIAPNVVARLAVGHTPGHSVVELESQGDRFVYVGDAIFPSSFEHPEWHYAFDTLPDKAIESRLNLLDRYADTGAIVAGAHLPFPAFGRVMRAGDAYRWMPIVWGY